SPPPLYSFPTRRSSDLAPRAIDRTVITGFRAVFVIQPGDQLLDVLNLVLVGDHHGVFGFHHDDVVQTQNGYQLAVAVHQAVAARSEEHTSELQSRENLV